MGLTTSCEAIERQANPAANEPEEEDLDGSHGRKTICTNLNSGSTTTNFSAPPPPPRSLPEAPPVSKRRLVESDLPKKKKSRQSPKHEPSTKSVITPKRQQKVPAKKPTLKSAPAKRSVSRPKKPPLTSRASIGDGLLPDVEAAVERSDVTSPPRLNAHKLKILIGKQALAAIKEGTRIYIKSGEGNGGDTWWDSGIVQKIHERGRRFEMEWEGINNRGEEVDTGGEKRIDLPVTYSLGGAAAAAIQSVPARTQAASLARKGVLAEARIGSWCIQHPEEPWGMLDPFGEDSI